MTQLYALGISHQSAPLALRTQAAFAAEHISSILHHLKNSLGFAKEVALISTCNRTEIYCASTADRSQTLQDISAWWATQQGLSHQLFCPHIYLHEKEAAVRHAFRVASGLESMILGEPQILGQMKQAMLHAQDAGSMGVMLHHLFNDTLSVAKYIRTHTDIGVHSISMASTSVKVVQRIFDDFSKLSVLCIGAGEMIQHCAAHFHANRPKQLVFSNRTHERAEHLATQYNGQTIPFNAIPSHLAQFDIVLVCTGSTTPLIGKEAVKSALKQRKHYPMVLIDLAVPRNIDPLVHQLEDAFVYTVDDLGNLIEQGMMLRQDAVPSAEKIIDAGVMRFMQWWQLQASKPSIQAFIDMAHQHREQVLSQAQKRLQKGEAPEHVLAYTSHQLTNKLLHGALHLMQHGTEAERDALTKLLPKLMQTHR